MSNRGCRTPALVALVALVALPPSAVQAQTVGPNQFARGAPPDSSAGLVARDTAGAGGRATVVPSRALVLHRVAESLSRHRAELGARGARYREDFKRSGYHTLLAAERLASAEGLRECDEIVQTARRLNEEYLSDARLISTASQREILAILASEPADTPLKRQFDSAHRGMLAFLEQVEFDYDAMFRDIDALLDFLESRSGSLQAEQGTLVFTSADDVAIYNEMLGRITSRGEAMRARARTAEEEARLESARIVELLQQP